ncbi:gliding motility-associated C-terminal domain-containing protein [Flavobacterium sp. N2469]|nr:gliding motility-associated C-terminal domain-containing protein [Flavobacterium sp. N2469]
MGLASATLPIAEPFTPTVITITNTGNVYNYGIGGGNQVNSPLTGGLFDMYGGVNTATGVQYILQENDPSRPVVSKLPNVLVAGASYNYSFDLGNRGSGSANKYIVLLYNADTKMPEKIIESGVLNTLPAVSDTPSYKNITGSFIPTSSANYYLLFYPSVSGGANDDFVIDRVAVVGSGVSACDIDNDGIPNYLDLDSDGDGCPDTKEAVLYNHSTEASIAGNVQNGSGGAVTSTVSTPNAMVPGPYGSNGFADALQLASDANAYKYVYTYLFLATLKDISACDNKFLMDIDSDDDGIPDAVESPSCFYTETQAMDITEGVTSDFTWQAANPLSNTYDDNIATTNFGTVTPAISIQNKALITFDLPVIDAALIDNVKLNVGSTAFGTGKWKLQGLDLNTMVWTDLSVSAGQAMSAASTTYTFTNTLMPATRYYSYRIIGIDNINITDTAKLIEFSIQYKNYNPSLHRTKMGCSSDLDGDGVPNYIDRDTDGDGCPDAVEAGISLSLLVPSNFYNIGGEVSGAHVIVGGNYSSNGMSDDVETTPDSGIINYNSTYTLYARNSAFNLCTDTDGDGIPDLIDIDDDNDGIPDAVESPSCFYSYDEISVPSTVTTAVANTGVLSNVNDSNKSTTFAFTNSATKANVTVFEMTPQYPLEATAMEIEMSTGGQTIFSATNASLAIDGWNGTTWVNLLPAFTPPTTGILNFMTFTFTQNQTVKYSKFRLQGLAGTVTNNLVKEIRLIPAITYVASANPKASCSDDYDGDGIPNHHDLDSDNDGCFDKYEAHVTGATLTGTYTDSLTVPANTTGDVGVNGLSNSVETVNDNAILNYNNTYQYAINAAIKFCTDTDGDGIPDSIDIDDDNDGILDTVEGNSDGEIAIKPTSNSFAFTSCSAPAAVVNNTVTFTTNGGVLSTATAADGFTYGEKGTGVDAGDKYSLTFATPVILSKLMVNSVFAPIGEFTVVYDDNTTATKLPVTIVAGQSPATYGYTNVSSSLSVNIDGTYGPYVANYLWGGSSNGQGGAILSFPTLSETKKIKSITFTIVAIPTGGTATLNGLVAPILRENCNLDTDNDGIPNNLDLDSDGDGCTDAFEAGTYNQSGVTMQAGNLQNGSGGAVTSTVSNPAAVVAGPYGNNGFADSVETAIDSGIYKAAYTYSDATTAAVHNCCPIITNNTISSNQTLCSNSTPATLSGSLPTLTPTGNTVLYQWMSSITSASTGFSNISGAVSQNYTFSAPLSQTTYFKRVAYVTGCSSSDNTSAVVTITVNSDTAGTASSTPTVCINTPITNITHTTSGATGIGTASDVDAGKITNSATATGKDSNNTTVTVTSDDPLTPAPGDSTVIDLPQSGKLDLKKTAVFNDTNNNGIAEAGETITYTFTVKNTGNVTITGITINDPLVAVTGGPISLAPNASDSTTFTAVYTIKQSDVDAGKITNSATATGTNPSGTPVAATSDDPLTPAPGDSTVIDLPQSGKLDLKKTAVFNDTNNNGIAEAGETITYTFTVKNIGNVTITGITINDPLVTVTGGPISLAPNASDSTTFTAVYTIKQSDVDAGKITNSATATGTNPSGTPVTVTSDDPLTPAPGDSTVIDLPQSGKLDLKKTAVFNDTNNNGIAEAGETITYSFTVKNTGSVTITGITINDPLVAVTGGPISLAPNASDSTTFTAVYTIKQSDVDAGKITNSATATGKDPNNTTVTATSDDPLTPAPGDSTVIDLPKSGKLDLKKTAVFNDTNNSGIAEAGETITYSFTVKNIGNVTITGITINDPLVTVTGGPISLAPNASDSTTFTAVYTIKQSDVDAGKITNIATATGKDPNNTTVTATSDDPLTPAPGDSTVIDLPQSGKLDLKKTAVFNDTNNNGIAEAGETITYSFTVKNTGNVTITGITINDPLVTVTGGPISLAPNASDSTTFTAVYTIKQSDVDAGKITNSATATGKDPNNTTVTATSDDPLTPAPGDSTVIDLPQSGNLELMKMAVFNDLNGNGIPEAGETITYTFTVKNIGSVTISNITINDPMVTVTGGPISLAPGAKDNTTFRAVYTVLQSDIDAGQVSNLAIVSGKTPDGTLVTAASDDPMTATPRDRTITPLPQSGKLDFKKTAVFNDENGNKTAEAGETITYSFIVKNTGSVTIKGITINDPLVAVTGGPIDLVPNASDSTTFKAVYKLTQDDVNAEGVTNQALVIGTEAGGIPIAAVSDDPSTPAPEDSTVTLLQPHGAISLKKKGEFNDINGNGSAEAGETITYSFEISNTGAVDLLNVALDDQLEGIVITGKTIPVLAVGATDSTTFKGTYTLTQADINRKQVDNQAVVSANTVKGQKVLAKSDDPLTAAVEDATVIHLKACELIVYDIVSPDGDGKNEELVIEGLDCYTSNKVGIYNRWGIKVFEMENYGTNGNAFNGYSDGRATYKRGQKLPTGTYYYILLVIDSNNTIHEKTGPIYVITD